MFFKWKIWLFNLSNYFLEEKRCCSVMYKVILLNIWELKRHLSKVNKSWGLQVAENGKCGKYEFKCRRIHMHAIGPVTAMHVNYMYQHI